MASFTHGQMMLFHMMHAVTLFVEDHLYVVATAKYHDLLLYIPEPSPSPPPSCLCLCFMAGELSPLPT